MSSLLEQAIVDATALKEAALKNAENIVLERYSVEVKDALDSLLEEAPAADTNFMDDVPLAHEDEDLKGLSNKELVTIDFDDIRQQLHAEKEGEEELGDELLDSEDLADQVFGDESAASLEAGVPGEAAPEGEDLDAGLDLSDDDALYKRLSKTQLMHWFQRRWPDAGKLWIRRPAGCRQLSSTRCWSSCLSSPRRASQWHSPAKGSPTHPPSKPSTRPAATWTSPLPPSLRAVAATNTSSGTTSSNAN